MKNLLRFSAMMLLALCCNMSAWADEVTFDFSTNAYGMTLLSGSSNEFNPDPYTDIVEGDVSIPLAGQTRYWKADPNQLRIYTDATATITVPQGKVITKVDIKVSTQAYGKGFKANDVDFEWEGSTGNGTWNGNANTVVVKWENYQSGSTTYKHGRINKIIVTYSSGEAPQPQLTISGETPFIGSTTVTITPSNADNAVYYTLDGSDPADENNSAAQTYSAPFTLTETTTVKAFEEGAELTAEKTFTKEATPTVNSIAEFRALPENSQAVLNLTNAQVVYTATSGENVMAFVRDNTAAIEFYNTGISLAANQTINGSAELTYVLYKNLPEATKNDNTNADNLTIADGDEAQPVTCTINEAKEKLCDLVFIENLTPKTIISGTTTRYYGFNEAGDSIQLYDQFKVAGMAAKLAALDPAKKYNVTGISAIYNTYYEIFVTDITEVGGGSVEPTVTEVNNIAEFRALAVGTDANLHLENAKVLYTWTSSNNNTMTFIRDASAAVELYNSGISLAANQDVNGTVRLSYTEVNNMPEGIANDNTNADNLTITDGDEAQPVTCTINEAKEKLCDLVYIENLTPKTTTSGTSTRYYGFNEAGDSIQLYNQFHLDGMDATLAGLDPAKKYNVTGISGVYKQYYEIFVIKIEEATVDGINNIDATRNDENAPLYNLAGQRVDNAYRGVVIKQGKKFLQK